MAKPGKVEMPFLDHLEELRWRLIWSLGAVVAGVLIGFVLVVKFNVISVLQQPIEPYLSGGRLVYTHPSDPFNISLTVSLAIGLVLAAPVVLYQIWAFVSPALYQHERRVVIPVLVGASLLFCAGVAASFYILLPFTLKFLTGFQSESLTPMITARDYFNFAVSMSLALGAVFEMPILILGLSAFGLVTPQFLKKFRRHAFVLCALASALLTPGDLITTTLIMIAPLYGLYEVSILLSAWLFRARERRRARNERESSTPAAAGVVLVVGLSLLAAGDLAAQQPTRPPRPTTPVRRPAVAPPRTPPDTGRRVARPAVVDPAAGDTVRRADALARAAADSGELVRWVEPDSVMRALMERTGFDVTRYQGDTVTFRIRDRTLSLVGAPAAVGRDQSLIVGDSIRYNDSTRLVYAAGSPAVLRDPTRTSDDVRAREIRYDLASRRANVSNIATSVVSGERWFVEGRRAAFAGDTAGGGAQSFYVREGVITSCDDSIPDYLFRAKQIKVVSKNVMVARPAILYIRDVPVFWFPFIFQDMRSGRRSGMLTPRFGLSELVRNSASYRRHVDNVGYYWNLGDYLDAQVALDWRSGARETEGDPGYLRLNGEVRYRWLDRFVSGRLATAQHRQRDGQRTTNVSWSHQQNFSSRTNLTMDINYATNTSVQRRTTFNPYQQLATIRSNANFQRSLGLASLSIGGSQTQYPGRETVDRTFPTLNVSSQPINLRSWLVWTPSFSTSTQQTLKDDRASGAGAFRFTPGPRPGLDSVRVAQNSRSTSASFDTPLQIAGYTLQNSFRFSDRELSYPQTVTVFRRGVSPTSGRDTSFSSQRVFARTYGTEIDWSPTFSLRPFLQGTWNLVPSITLQNVESRGGTFVRTNLSGGEWVTQGKRLAYGVSLSPTIYGLFPGFLGATRFRHAIQPSITYSLAPSAKVGEDYLRALNIDPVSYIGSIAQSSVSTNLSTNLEAKVRTPNDTNPEGGTKLKVLSLNFDGVTYNIAKVGELRRRAVAQGRERPGALAGFESDRFGISGRSDLLPGFDVRVGFDLFQGEVISDTARFKPYREDVNVSFSIGRGSRLIDAVMTRIFGKAVPDRNAQPTATDERPDDAQEGQEAFMAQQVASQRVAGEAARMSQFSIPRTGQGWQASVSFTAARQRPVTGDNVRDVVDPRCAGLRTQFERDLCQTRLLNSQPQAPIGSPTYGGTVFRQPARSAVQSNLTFNVTQRWAAQWSTTYDVEAGQFASHMVNLQRELHDWRAVFAFTQAPNGNFAFNFFIALKAQPDIKFDYDRQTFRPGSGGAFQR